LQRTNRLIVAGTESAVTGVVSIGFGLAGAAVGETLVLEGGGLAGYPVGQVASSVWMDMVVWPRINQTYLPDRIFGSYYP